MPRGRPPGSKNKPKVQPSPSPLPVITQYKTKPPPLPPEPPKYSEAFQTLLKRAEEKFEIHKKMVEEFKNKEYPKVDIPEYSVEDLKKYREELLKLEERARINTQSGQLVIVDLTGLPPGVYDQIGKYSNSDFVHDLYDKRSKLYKEVQVLEDKLSMEETKEEGKDEKKIEQYKLKITDLKAKLNAANHQLTLVQ